MLLTQTAPIIKVHIYEAQKFGSVCVLDCKTLRIFAYSSTREQSNERSGTRLKTESETGERRFSLAFLSRASRSRLLRHALPISLLILRKKKNDCLAVYLCPLSFSILFYEVFLFLRISTLTLLTEVYRLKKCYARKIFVELAYR